ncbi:DUF726-domain-containing protein [Neoconidiobolus thromboides FSU 785]|nr:DUF726-domain-containing protein [Neoconidiobolus thromboides FSU 785]
MDNLSNRNKHIEATKDIFTDEEKFAYVALCRVLLTQQTSKYPFKIKEYASANASYTVFAKKIMKKLYNHMAVSEEEQVMIDKLCSHGVIPSDLSKTILSNCTTKEARLNKATIEKLNETNQIDVPKGSQTLKIDIRWTIILDLFLLLTNEDIYDSRSRTLLKAMAEEIKLDWFDVIDLEKRVAEQFQINEVAEALTHTSETKARKKTNLKSRLLLIGVATVGGSVIIGLSAGLLAPVIATGVGAAFTGLGLAGTSTFFAGAGGTALIATGGVVAGGTIAGQKMEKRTRGVNIFEFLPIYDNKRSSVLLSITGWLPGKGEDVTKPFSMVDSRIGDHFSLLWEPEALKHLGNSLKLLAGEVLSFAAQEILKHTLLSALLAALAVPMALSKLGYLVDNPWSNGLVLAEKAGLVLADILLNHAQGHRPVSLVGFSLGARVIFYCLLELSRLKAFGIVENVYIFGAPITASQKQWKESASVVSGRFVNGHVKSDWILGFLYRAASTSFSIAGLNPVQNVEGVENVDVTHLVSGHLAYRHMMPTLMKEVGIPVTSETFEDEDEENTNEPSELEVSDNLEAIIKGQVPNPAAASAANPKPKSGTRNKSWYDTSVFNKLRWTGKSSQPKDEIKQVNKNDNKGELKVDPYQIPKAKSPSMMQKAKSVNISNHGKHSLSTQNVENSLPLYSKKDPLILRSDSEPSSYSLDSKEGGFDCAEMLKHPDFARPKYRR